MAKKVIQVPIDEYLLERLNTVSRKQQCTRSEFIRNACIHFLSHVEQEEMDRLYREGYVKFPEELEAGGAQVALSRLILPKESW